MRRETTALLALPLLIAVSTCCAAQESAGSEQQRARATAALVKKGDPDSLAAAAVLSVIKHPEQSLDLLRRAVAGAPERPDLLWLNVQFCEKQRVCDPEALEMRLREVDGANGAGWLGALARAESLGDESAADVALAAIGRSARVDIYYTTLLAHLSGAAAQTRAISSGAAGTYVIGVLAAQAIPAYSTVVKSCKGERLERSDVLQTCRGIARAFEAGDAAITESIGIRIAERVWPEQSSEWAAAVEARRIYEYRASLLEKIESKAWDEQRVADYVALCTQSHREQDVLRAQLVAAGEDPDPPRH